MINLSTEVLEARKIQLLLLQELLKVCNEHNLKIFVTILFSALTRMFPKPTFAP